MFGTRYARRMDRFTQFAIASAMEAQAQSGLIIDDFNRDRIGAVIGTGIGGISTLNRPISCATWPGPASACS